MQPIISLIGFGEAGAIFGEDFAALGLRVYAYDHALTDKATSVAMQHKAALCGVQLCDSMAAAIEHGDWIISAVTAANALDVVRIAAPLMRLHQLFVDINSVAPATKRDASAILREYGIDYLDAAVMAPIPPHRLKTPILLGGAGAGAAVGLFNEMGMNVRKVADEVGVASAIKMCRSIMIKGLEALTTECISTARQYGVEGEVLASLHHSFPSMGWNNELPHYLVSRVAEHGRRRAEEMQEVAQTCRDVGVAGSMSQATVTTQRHLVEAMVDAEINYSDLQPFNCFSLVDSLYGADLLSNQTYRVKS
jgi:3-hydroxyisobutyrate dehydrogenase-like beta-hydroxyacid dehydrogenase